MASKLINTQAKKSEYDWPRAKLLAKTHGRLIMPNYDCMVRELSDQSIMVKIQA